MRIVSIVLAFALLLLGAGFAWVGFEVGYRAIDPDAYRDSKPIVYLVAGGLFTGIGLACLLAAIAIAGWALDKSAPRWLFAVPFALGCVPYPWLFGAPALVFNLLLLGLGVLLLSRTREQSALGVHGPTSRRPLH